MMNLQSIKNKNIKDLDQEFIQILQPKTEDFKTLAKYKKLEKARAYTKINEGYSLDYEQEEQEECYDDDNCYEGEQCTCDCEMGPREESLLSDVLSLAINSIIVENECLVVDKPQQKLTDETIQKIIAVLDKKQFYSENQEDSLYLLCELVEEISKFIGINPPYIKCTVITGELDEGCDEQFYKEIQEQAKRIKENESTFDFNNFATTVINPTYGVSSCMNDINLSFYMKDFHDVINKALGVKRSGFEKFAQPSYISTIRHECQHLYQYAKIRDFFGGKYVENKYKVMGIAEVMSWAVLDYMSENGVDDFESEEISYRSNALEMDARHSEFMLIKSLIDDERIPEHNKRLLKSYMFYLITNFMVVTDKFEDNSKLAERRVRSLRFEFEKCFKGLPLATFLVNELTDDAINAYVAEIEKESQMYKQELAQLMLTKRQNKIEHSKAKKIDKVQKLNAIYESEKYSNEREL